jgi:hypothetical protein
LGESKVRSQWSEALNCKSQIGYLRSEISKRRSKSASPRANIEKGRWGSANHKSLIVNRKSTISQWPDEPMAQSVLSRCPRAGLFVLFCRVRLGPRCCLFPVTRHSHLSLLLGPPRVKETVVDVSRQFQPYRLRHGGSCAAYKYQLNRLNLFAVHLESYHA